MRSQVYLHGGMDSGFRFAFAATAISVACHTLFFASMLMMPGKSTPLRLAPSIVNVDLVTLSSPASPTSGAPPTDALAPKSHPAIDKEIRVPTINKVSPLMRPTPAAPKTEINKPDPIKPDLVKPELVKPEPPKPAPVKPQPVKPEPVKPEPIKPIMIKPEPVRVEPVRPEPIKPKRVEPQPSKPEPAKSEPSSPLPAEPVPIKLAPEKKETPPPEPPSSPKIKTSMKKKTFKPDRVREQALAQIKKQVEGPRSNPTAAAIDRLKEKDTLSEALAGLKRKVSQGPPGRGGKGGQATADLIQIYRIQVAFEVQRNWAFSEQLAGLESNLITLILFKVLPDGTIKDVTFTDRSGNSYLDESAERAVWKSNPVSPHPPGISKSSIMVGLRFTPQGVIR